MAIPEIEIWDRRLTSMLYIDTGENISVKSSEVYSILDKILSLIVTDISIEDLEYGLSLFRKWKLILFRDFGTVYPNDVATADLFEFAKAGEDEPVHGLIADPLSDMLTRIRNAQLRRSMSVTTPASKLRARVLDVLKSEGYIRGYNEVSTDSGKPGLEVDLIYGADNEPVIAGFRRISNYDRFRHFDQGNSFSIKYSRNISQKISGILLIQTTLGIVSDTEAKENNLPGEIIYNIFGNQKVNR